jgi:hypothetical protein
MPRDTRKIIQGKPTRYSFTSTAEVESRNIFYNAIDPLFVKGEIRVSDKYPNSDGILELTDSEGFPIGRIDIQLKTLPKKNYKSPSYSCEGSFFAHCENSAIPVILVVVNRQDKKVYWRHIDRETLLEVSGRIVGKSLSISIPKENFIDKTNTGYINEWAEKAKEAIDKVWNYDSLQIEKKILEQKLNELDSKMQSPTRLPLPILKDIHGFLDRYNYILDLEFGCVKKVLYPDYWKIGIGILRYEIGNIRFLLYPVEFKKLQILVKEVKADDYEDLSREMAYGNILLIASLITDSKLRQSPDVYAYNLLEDSIMGIAGKYNFPIASEFLAHEYLISFIDRNHGYLDMEIGALSYQLKDLKFKLFSVLPMIAARGKSYADWVVEHNDDIDSYRHWKPSEHHRKRLQENIEIIRTGFVPKVKVTMTSTLYNMDLINYYIKLLEARNISEARRKYKLGQFNENMYGVDFWKTWNKDVLWYNVKLFLKNFHELYQDYLKTHFSFIQNSLQIIPNNEITVVYILQFDEIKKSRPCMEVYHLRCSRRGKGEVLCFLEEDPLKPIDRREFGLESKYDCTINGVFYEILQMHVQVLDFMFEISPTYALINDHLSKKLKEFFNKKRK